MWPLGGPRTAVVFLVFLVLVLVAPFALAVAAVAAVVSAVVATARWLAYQLVRFAGTTLGPPIGLVLAVVAGYVLITSRPLGEVALVTSATALTLAAVHYWRVDWKRPELRVALLDDCRITMLGPSKPHPDSRFVADVQQTCMIENTGALPCVVTRIAFSDYGRHGYWWSSTAELAGGLVDKVTENGPQILRPGDPNLFGLHIRLEARFRFCDGRGVRMEKNIQALELAGIGRLELTYTGRARTARQHIMLPPTGCFAIETIRSWLVNFSKGTVKPGRITDKVTLAFNDMPNVGAAPPSS